MKSKEIIVGEINRCDYYDNRVVVFDATYNQKFFKNEEDPKGVNIIVFFDNGCRRTVSVLADGTVTVSDGGVTPRLSSDESSFIGGIWGGETHTITPFTVEGHKMGGVEVLKS